MGAAAGEDDGQLEHERAVDGHRLPAGEDVARECVAGRVIELGDRGCQRGAVEVLPQERRWRR